MPGSLKAEAAQSNHYATGLRTVLFEMGVERMVPIFFFQSHSFLKFQKGSEHGTSSFISDAVRRNERNGNLPEVSLAIRLASSFAYGGKHLRRVCRPSLANISMQLESGLCVFVGDTFMGDI